MQIAQATPYRPKTAAGCRLIGGASFSVKVTLGMVTFTANLGRQPKLEDEGLLLHRTILPQSVIAPGLRVTIA